MSSFAFPVVRRVFPSLIANQIVSVQPMSMPSGLMFYNDYMYGGIGNKYKNTKLRVSHIYKAVVVRGISVPLYDNHLNKIGEVKPYDLCMYLKTDVVINRQNTQSLKCHRIMVGDQAGWVNPEEIRFKRVTPRMVRRQELKALKETEDDEQRRLSEMGELPPDGKHTI